MAQMWPPKKNTAFDLYFEIRNASTGAVISGAAGLDSERSIDGAAFSDCTNEATEIGSTGIYKLALTSGEMNGDVIIVQTKSSTTNAMTVVNVLYTTESTWDEGIDVKAVLADAIATASFADGAMTVAKFAADALTGFADALLKRDMSAVSGEAARSPLNALRFLRNKFNILAGTLTVMKEDDSSTAWTAAITTTAGNPVSQSDPA